jgi:hypothetical protein
MRRRGGRFSRNHIQIRLPDRAGFVFRNLTGDAVLTDRMRICLSRFAGIAHLVITGIESFASHCSMTAIIAPESHRAPDDNAELSL